MAHLTVTQRIEILIFIGCGKETRTQQEVCKLFNAKYLDNPITQSTVSKIESKFREPVWKRTPRERTSTLVASENEVSQTTVLCILRKKNYHPYKFQLVCGGPQCVGATGLPPRLPRRASGPAYAIVTFVLNGTVNKQNCRYRSTENPHWMMEANTQYPEKGLSPLILS
ncbi:hypothetical protein NQ318_006532 [Aromia moschata]|uniref:DUF4817 domain-containing protein n=1 Tax=Aromia moschata TaxID=1265417 RepID=A0AAV8YPN9_9CUCU|nr:hypothetical protein NQ318_006532 [Aromia moschata]